MKAITRPLKLDQLSVKQGDREIHIHTHRQTISISVYDRSKLMADMQLALLEFSFEELSGLLISMTK